MRHYLFMIHALLLTTLLIPGSALAQPTDSNQPPPESTETTGEGPCGATDNCSDLTSCEMETLAEVKIYACLAYHARLSCIDALKKTPLPLSDDKYDVIRDYYQDLNSASDCWPPHPLQTNWLATSLVTGKGHGKFFRHAFQIMPSFSVGIPIVFFGKENDAELALRNVHAVGGLFARYSPTGLWISVHGFAGTSTVSSTKLDPTRYPSPAMLLYGGGIDGLGGLVSLSVLGASLRPDGLFSRSAETAAILQLGIDLTAVGITASGLIAK
ncbi:hypothetical protein [Sorangium sp. So ce542]|uniref:hypothetical protein n=1 Tax=Sorangium sp. So ce542 TaxID=3133316 RepID=UPI003F5E4B29